MTERRVLPRHAIVVPALCTRRDESEFHAVTVDMSTVGLKLRSATLPRADERLICNIRGVGAINACVVWVEACDFAIRVTGTDPAPGEVARRLVELARQQKRSSEIVRVDRRIVPTHTEVQVTLAGGLRVMAQITNLSASGVALALDVSLTVGQEIVIGRRRATVARQIERGIGAAFLEPLDDAAIGGHTVL